jgi:hypothetical protein
MKSLSGFFKILLVFVIVGGCLVFVVTNYSWVFSKRITGQVVDVERVTDPSAIYGSRPTAEQMYSYSVLIQGDDGHLYTASSEDRQWQVVKKGYCVDALLFRYPPWHFQNAGTFFNARLKDVRVCPGQTELPQNTPGAAGPRADGQQQQQQQQQQAPPQTTPVQPAPVPGSH